MANIVKGARGAFENILDHGASEISSDNSTAIQEAIDAVAASGGIVLVPQGSFEFQTTLTNPAGVPIVCMGELVYTGSGADALVIGPTSAPNIEIDGPWPSIIRLRRGTQSWADAHVGMRLVNIEQWRGEVSIDDFETGLQLDGVGDGCAYNEIRVQRIFGCRVGLELRASASGFCNENRIYGGRVGTLQATSSALNVHGVRFTCNSLSSRPNGNKVRDMSIELYNAGAGFTSAIHGTVGVGSISGNFNELTGLRIESTDYRLSGAGFRDNDIGVTYSNADNEASAATFVNGDTADDSRILEQNNWLSTTITLGARTPIRVGGWRRSQFCILASGSALFRPPCGVVWSASTTSVVNSTVGTLDHDSVQINSTNGVGVALDLRNCSKDVARTVTLKAQVRTQGGRFFAVCFDSSYNLLTASSHCSLTYAGSPGYYRSGTDMTADAAEAVVTFSSSVAFVIVGVASGTAQADVDAFDVLALGAADIRQVSGRTHIASMSTSVASPTPAQTDEAGPIATSIPAVPSPTTDTPTGTVVRNVSAAAGVSAAWVYTGSVWLGLPTLVDTDSDGRFGAASFASFSGTTYGSGTTRRVQIDTTTSGGTPSLTLYVNEGSRNTRARLFLTDGASQTGGWGLWLNHSSGGLQPFVIGFGAETAQLQLASGSSSSSSMRGGAATGNGTGGSLTLEGGTGAGTGGGGGLLTLRGGTANDGAGGGVTIDARDGVSGNRNGGTLTLRAGRLSGSGTDGDLILDPSTTRGVRFGSSSGHQLNYGSGSPESSLTAVAGSLYMRTAGSQGDATLYYKENGSGNTGWRPVIGQGGARTVLGVTGNAAATRADIAGAGTNAAGQYSVLCDDGTSLAFRFLSLFTGTLATDVAYEVDFSTLATNDLASATESIDGLTYNTNNVAILGTHQVLNGTGIQLSAGTSLGTGATWNTTTRNAYFLDIPLSSIPNWDGRYDYIFEIYVSSLTLETNGEFVFIGLYGIANSPGSAVTRVRAAYIRNVSGTLQLGGTNGSTNNNNANRSGENVIGIKVSPKGEGCSLFGTWSSGWPSTLSADDVYPDESSAISPYNHSDVRLCMGLGVVNDASPTTTAVIQRLRVKRAR